MSEHKHLYLIDAHALIFRAYYAMIRNPLATAAGQPTSAILGFANYLLRLLSEYSCPYLAAVFDSGRDTFRREIYAEYKANRKETPDDLRSQLPFIHRLVEHLGIPALMKEGYEADDIIAHLTRVAVERGFAVSLVTKDKDLMQLVGERVTMLSPETGGQLSVWGPAQVREKMGVEPGKIRDLLALMGDASDNIPGVPGVGPKTAVKILDAAGSIEAIWANPALIANDKLRARLLDNKEQVEISAALATLHDDIDYPLELEALKAASPNRADCVALFKELEFHSLLKHPLFEVREKASFDLTIIDSLDALGEVARRIIDAGEVSIDTETTSMNPLEAELVGVSLAISPDAAWYLPLGHRDAARNLPLDAALAVCRPFIESAEVAKIGQNLKYDYQVFKRYDITLRGIGFDSMIAAYLIDPGKRQFNLDGLARQWLDLRLTEIETLIGKGKNQICFSETPVDEAARYAGEDVVAPLLLRERLLPILTERKLVELFERIELPLIPVLAEMERRGVRLDSELLGAQSAELTGKLQAISADIFAMAGEEFNLNSPKQVSEVLFERLGLPRSRKTKTGLSTNVAALEKLAPEYPIARGLLDYREVQKLLSTYIDALPGQISDDSGRLHTSFNQTVAATGRLSSTHPNLQNIPIRTEAGRRIREAFVADDGQVLVSADYSQIELRILAHLSEDSRMIEAFAGNKDIHTQTASAMYGLFPEMVTPEMRRAAKTINFGLMYGMGPINLSRQLGISFKEARAFIETYFEQFPTIRTLMERLIALARERGYSETLLGRRRYLPDINASSRQVREAAERTAINTPVQGTAADIIKLAMITIQRDIHRRFPGAVMLLQVHDELVFEAPAEQAEPFGEWVAAQMSGAYALKTPLRVEVGFGPTWAAAH
jgi:DNA polymerase-1